MNTTTTTTTSYREKEAKQLAEYLLSREVVFRASSGLGVSVVVDGFRFAHEQSSHVHERFPNTDDTPPHMRRCTIFFLLSHFHSDHYTGITADWPHGSIYGSPTTMALVQKRLRLPATKVMVLEMGHVHHFNLHRGTYEGSHEEQSPQSPLPLPLDSATMEVRLLPANHCPGAVMFLISTHEDGHILHTGDFRCAKVGPQPDPYEEDIFAHPYLRCVRGEVARLFMDNTYCNPVYRFPSQPEAAEALEDHLRKLVQHVVAQGTRKKPRCLVLIGSYVIGKERLALGLQQRLPQGQSRKDRVPIYVSSSKMSLITTMDFFAHHFRALHSTTATKTEEEEAQDGDVHVRGVAPTGTEVRWMPPTERALNFEDAELKDEHGHEGGCCCDLTIILASMAAVGYTALSTTMGKSEAGGATPPLLDLGDGIGADLSCYDVVLAVEPTGWTKSVKAQPLSPSLHRLRVPYSEHSSFEELRGFVTELNPREIIPTVSLAQYNQQETQFAQVAPRLRCRGTAPLSRYFERRPAAPSAPATSKAPDEEPATTHKPGNPFHLSAEVEGAAALPRGEGGGEEASCHQQPSRKRAHVGAPTGLSRWMQRAAHIDVAEIDEDEEDVVITGASAPQIVEISDED